MTPRAAVTTGASPEAIGHHYDVSAEFYRLWLDELMAYSCGRWSGQRDLDSAQKAKIDYFLTGTAACTGPLLDIGCGWGSLLVRARDAHGIRQSFGLTLSQAQAAVAREKLGDDAEIRVESWEDHVPCEPYGAVVSIGALEHFASPGLSTSQRIDRYRSFFEKVHGILKPGGRLGLQTIAFDQADEQDHGPLSEFFQNKIFPESTLPRLTEILAAAEPTFHLVSVECDAGDYARTCREWLGRLSSQRAQAERLVGPEVVQRYLRYLSAARIAFRRADWTLTRSIFIARREPRSLTVPSSLQTPPARPS